VATSFRTLLARTDPRSGEFGIPVVNACIFQNGCQRRNQSVPALSKFV
jgi:hypothetical protein